MVSFFVLDSIQKSAALTSAKIFSKILSPRLIRICNEVSGADVSCSKTYCVSVENQVKFFVFVWLLLKRLENPSG